MKGKTLALFLALFMSANCDNPRLEGKLLTEYFQGNRYITGNEKYVGNVELASGETVKVVYYKKKAIKASEKYEPGDIVIVKRGWFGQDYDFVDL